MDHERYMRMAIAQAEKAAAAGEIPVGAVVVCGDTVDESMKNDIAIAERLRITATTLDGILTVKGQGREKGGSRHERG